MVMETLTVVLFYFIEFVLGTTAFIYWMKHRSNSLAAKSRFVEFLQSVRHDANIEQIIDGLASGKTSVFEKKKFLSFYLLTGASMFVGVGLLFVIVRFMFPGLGLAFRTVLGCLLIAPFIVLVAIAVAEEMDQVKILSFEKASAERALTHCQNGTLEAFLAEL
jgi:hypothetical protein